MMIPASRMRLIRGRPYNTDAGGMLYDVTHAYECHKLDEDIH